MTRAPAMAYDPDRLRRAMRELHDYWHLARDGRCMPGRRDIDPVTLPRRLPPDLLLIDVLAGPPRFRIRLMGTGIVAVLGEDWTGRFVDEIDSLSETVSAQYLETVTKATPTLHGNDYISIDPRIGLERRLEYERLLLPLSEDGETVSMLLGCTIVRPVDG